MTNGKISKSIVVFLLILASAAVAFPLIYMFMTSLKTHQNIILSPFTLPSELQFENYFIAWTDTNLGLNFLNSIIVSVGTLLFLIMVVLMGGYALSRYPFPGNKIVFIGLIALIAIPVHSLLVPIYYFMETLGLRNSLIGVILLYTAINLPFSLIIMRTFFEQMPRAIEEAAEIDGCNIWQVFWHVAIPMAKVPIATIAIINIINIWSEYLFASVLLVDSTVRTLPVAIAILQSGEQGLDLGILFAGLSIVTIPMLIIYLIFSKQITQGVASGAVK
ncbi:carbohydrate ABC transporter permease [Gracilibacillus sp. YIM 98692]|uniref:carbohydrate ABC transporter permease n=1 Tax=Gracilibacillus sp. YIM 98692 TaxID=2663532 RepID=UPI0013CFC108|nr:carbohydrate ABC transporter permease [Gracilibacillus sp. YIM 98692]